MGLSECRVVRIYIENLVHTGEKVVTVKLRRRGDPLPVLISASISERLFLSAHEHEPVNAIVRSLLTGLTAYEEAVNG